MWSRKNNQKLTIDPHSIRQLTRVFARLNEIVGLMPRVNSDGAALTRVIELLRGCQTPMALALHNIPLSTYARLYGQDAVASRRFVNLGAGSYWSHPAWIGVDAVPSGPGDLAHDFSAGMPLPLADSSVKLIYSSHLLEHLTDAEVQALLAEAHRVLEPGGRIRVVVPDLDTAIHAYRQGWREVFLNVNDYAVLDSGQPLRELLVELFAAPALKRLGEAELVSMLEELGPEQAIARMCASITREQVPPPGPHINWFNKGRLGGLLADAGFTEIQHSAFGQSATLVLRDTNFFDCTAPEISVFVDACKS